MDTTDHLRVLVTGATGFLGGNILRALADNPRITRIAACRDAGRLPPQSADEVRVGDLLDPQYRRELMRGVDVVCHAGTWASMWGHRRLEQERFFEPTRDLVDQAIAQGVGRFILASTVAIGEVRHDGTAHDDDSPRRHTGFWPHLDRLIDLDRYLREQRGRGTRMVNLRLGHFVGPGNRLGMLPALVPRLKTYLVPWLGGGHRRLPLIADRDLGRAFERAAVAEGLEDYESFNICGREFPTLREVVTHIAGKAGVPTPLYSVPFPAGYAFGALMETLHPLLPGSSPFLTRSIVHLCEDWYCPGDKAGEKLGYRPQIPWREAIDAHLDDLREAGYPWPLLCQP